MVKTRIDMTGWKMCEHGVPDSRLTVIKRIEDYVKPDGKHEVQYLCECGCEEHNLIKVLGYRLTSKTRPTKSCGCLTRELASERLHKTNKYDLTGKYGIGWTSNTNREFYFDLEDYDKIKDYCWYEQGHTDSYCSLEAVIPDSKKHTRMHVILGFKGYDHIDRNPFNNCKANLRPATIKENNRNRSLDKRNTSGFTGVRWRNDLNKWIADIRINKKTKHIGVYSDKNDAVRARLEAEAKYFGEFAPQRHLFEEYGITTQN